MTNPRRVLDLFCGAGGAGYGYYLAGCDVTGVDTSPQPHYPFTFVQADALTVPLDGYDLIHASPPCQAYSATYNLTRGAGWVYPDLIAQVRERLIASGTAYVIENVMGAPLLDPVMLCGTMFGLRVYRHRLFECSFLLPQPAHPEHLWETARINKTPAPGQMRSPVGHFPDAEGARRDMGTYWMTRDEMRQAIPPAFTRYIAEHGGSRQCQVCRRWWSPQRSHAKTCSPACRKTLSRGKPAAERYTSVN